MIKRVINRTVTAWLVTIACLSWCSKAEALSYGQYPSNEERRYVNYCDAFHRELNAWDGGEGFSPWLRTRYHWATTSLLRDRYRYANYDELAYFAGHGNPHIFHTCNGSVDLGDGTVAWGVRGQTKVVAFQACQVTRLVDNWRGYWKANSAEERLRKPFAGVDVICGFSSNHSHVLPPTILGPWSGHYLAHEFGENLKSGYSVRRAWYKACESTRSVYWVMGNQDRPSILYIGVAHNDTLMDLMRHRWDVRYGDSRYMVYAYYMTSNAEPRDDVEIYTLSPVGDYLRSVMGSSY